MSAAQLTAIGSVLVFLSLCSLIWAATFLVSDKRARRKAEQTRKHVTIVDPLSPEPLTARWCGSCARRVVNPPNEVYQACPVCGSELAHVSLVVDAQPPDEPPTLPEAS